MLADKKCPFWGPPDFHLSLLYQNLRYSSHTLHPHKREKNLICWFCLETHTLQLHWSKNAFSACKLSNWLCPIICRRGKTQQKQNRELHFHLCQVPKPESHRVCQVGGDSKESWSPTSCFSLCKTKVYEHHPEESLHQDAEKKLPDRMGIHSK